MWYDRREHYGGVGVSEKVVRTVVIEEYGFLGRYLDVQAAMDGAFEKGDEVVVIPAKVYDFLKQAEALVANGVVLDADEYVRLKGLDARVVRFAAHIGVPVDYDMPPLKRCAKCDGNNVNAPCTCEEV